MAASLGGLFKEAVMAVEIMQMVLELNGLVSCGDILPVKRQSLPVICKMVKANGTLLLFSVSARSLVRTPQAANISGESAACDQMY